MSVTDSPLQHITNETADRLCQTVLVGHPVTTKLIISSLSDYLKDEEALADLTRRALTGVNSFGQLVLTLIRDEAEQIALTTLAAAALEAM